MKKGSLKSVLSNLSHIKKTTFFGRAFKEEGSYLIPSASIELIIKKNKLNVKLTKLAYWLQNYLTQPSKPKRVGKKLIRFWYFKDSEINLEQENEEGDEE